MRVRCLMRACAAACVLLIAPRPAAQADEVDLAGVTLRARVTAMTPEAPVRIFWRFGGEGQGGSPVRGEFTKLKRSAPPAPKEPLAAAARREKLLGGEDDLLDDLVGGDRPREDQVEIEGKGFNFVYLRRGTWSPDRPLEEFALGRKWPTIFTITLLPLATSEVDVQQIRNVKMEFELRRGERVLKRFSEAGPDGATVGIALPLRNLQYGLAVDDPRFLQGVCGLEEYALQRAQRLAALPWARRPVPKRYAIVTDCTGYDEGVGYGVRTTNLKVVENEFRTLRQLGVNGLRGAPRPVIEMANRGEGFAKDFRRALITVSMDYPVPAARPDLNSGWFENVPDGAGDPFYPGTFERARPQIEATVERMLGYTGFDQVWGLTNDEIGCIFDRSAEGKNVRFVSPTIMDAFRKYLADQGLTPQQCGATSWDQVDPWTSSEPRPLSWQQTLAQQKEALYQKTLGFKVKVPGEGDDTGAGLDVLDDLARQKEDTVEEQDDQSAAGRPGLPVRAKNLIAYYNSRFSNYASAIAFTPLRDAIDAANQRKRDALARGETDSPAARQPWIYSYALRGQTFIRRHSLDFFEFYRHADNGFVYETSHTDRPTQIFDSYICDVGRVVSENMNKQLGIYVKPHRGSANQRAMSFVSRGGTLLYWYTYGPSYGKGDSFSTKPWLLDDASRFARILARAEDVLYGARWQHRPEVAVVKPRTTILQGGAIGNALWVYGALAHAHVPVDPLDEEMLATSDLSQYKVVYVSGTYLRRDAAEKLAQYVNSGGTLYTSDGSCTLDEARQPLDVLAPVFGLKSRGEWQRYTPEQPAPPGARLVPAGPFTGRFTPTARELIEPGDATDVLVRCADGAAAVTRHRYGRGYAYVVGFAAGSEYGSHLRKGSQSSPVHMERNADPGRRSYVAAPALERVTPPVEVSRANVEAVLVRHPESGRRAVTLANWAYAADQAGRLRQVEFRDLEITIAGADGVSRVVSAWLDREVPMEKDGDRLRVTLPTLSDCDVLLLE